MPFQTTLFTDHFSLTDIKISNREGPSEPLALLLESFLPIGTKEVLKLKQVSKTKARTQKNKQQEDEREEEES